MPPAQDIREWVIDEWHLLKGYMAYCRHDEIAFLRWWSSPSTGHRVGPLGVVDNGGKNIGERQQLQGGHRPPYRCEGLGARA